jgi:hypothetical protein
MLSIAHLEFNGNVYAPGCDFCSSTDVAWIYPIRDFTFALHTRLVVCTGYWGICDCCHRFVIAKDSRGLIKHIAQRYRVDLTARPLAAAVLSAEVEGFLRNAGTPTQTRSSRLN